MFRHRAEALEAVGLSEQAMAQENVEIVRRVIESHSSDNVEEGLALAPELMHPEGEFISVMGAVDPKVYRGYEGLQRYVRDLAESFEEWRNEVEEIYGWGQTPSSRRYGRESSERGAACRWRRDWVSFAWCPKEGSCGPALTQALRRPSKPWGYRSRRCRRRTWRSRGRRWRRSKEGTSRRSRLLACGCRMATRNQSRRTRRHYICGA